VPKQWLAWWALVLCARAEVPRIHGIEPPVIHTIKRATPHHAPPRLSG